MIDKAQGTKELIFLIVFSILLWFVLSAFDAFELIVEYLESHEDYELDEVLLLVIIFGFLSIFYSIRRVKESNKINKQLSTLNEKLEKKINSEISKRQERDALLVQQSKMASMGEMIGNIAHQWRQPLNALSLVIQNINFSYQMDELDDKIMNESLKKATMLTSNMSKTIDDFRFFYKPNKEKNVFFLDDTIERTINLIDSSFKHNNIEIDFKKSSEFKLYGFPNEFSQTVLNILNNAKDALLDNKIEEAVVKISSNQDKDFIYIFIEDNAGGIPEDIIDKIFIPYFTTKDEGSGTGIGLYMSKIIIEKNMNGKIDILNTKRGAKFIIKMPIFKDENE